jgi:hypothetical protein
MLILFHLCTEFSLSYCSFPTHTFPSEIHVYRPPQAVKDAHIVKITNCDDTFAALTSNGELFVFSVPKAGEADESVSSGKERMSIKPQRVWALRKQFSAVAVRFFDSLFLIALLLKLIRLWLGCFTWFRRLHYHLH